MAGPSGEQKVESWLLPELGDDAVVQAKRRSAGFSSRPESQGGSARRSAAAPLTRSRVDAMAREAREQAFDDGRAEGYQKGYAEGEARARDLGSQQAATTLQALQQLLDSVTVQVSTEQDALAAALVEVVRKIAAAACYRAFDSDESSTIALVVEQAVAALPLGEKHVCLHLNPADIDLLKRQKGFLKTEWQLVADEALVRGDVRVSSEFSAVDATTSKRLDDIIAAVFDRNASDNSAVAAGEPGTADQADSKPEASRDSED